VDMEHVLFTDYSDPACGDLMNSPPAGYPITNDYSAQNRGEIRIHRKF